MLPEQIMLLYIGILVEQAEPESGVVNDDGGGGGNDTMELAMIVLQGIVVIILLAGMGHIANGVIQEEVKAQEVRDEAAAEAKKASEEKEPERELERAPVVQGPSLVVEEPSVPGAVPHIIAVSSGPPTIEAAPPCLSPVARAPLPPIVDGSSGIGMITPER